MDDQEIQLTLPWPPSVNAYWQPVKMGKTARIITSAKGKEYRAKAAAAIFNQGLVFTNLQGRLAVEITAYPPDRRIRDLDNTLKASLDALTKAEVWIDDVQVDDLRITRGHVVKGGLLEITIKPLEV